MKIPTKIQANIQTQELKRQQIKEGTEMVERVEALRKALNSLQDQHKHFIENSKEELMRETTELFGQKETLKAEVASLTVVKIELQKPLDDEWKKLKDAQIIFEREKEKFTVADDKLDARERELKVREARIDITLERAEKSQIESENRNKEAESNEKESENILKAMRNSKQEADVQIAQRMEEMKKKEDEVEFEKQGVEHVKKLNQIKEKELNERERQIKDKEQTFLRNKKRDGN